MSNEERVSQMIREKEARAAWLAKKSVVVDAGGRLTVPARSRKPEAGSEASREMQIVAKLRTQNALEKVSKHLTYIDLGLA